MAPCDAAADAPTAGATPRNKYVVSVVILCGLEIVQRGFGLLIHQSLLMHAQGRLRDVAPSDAATDTLAAGATTQKFIFGVVVIQRLYVIQRCLSLLIHYSPLVPAHERLRGCATGNTSNDASSARTSPEIHVLRVVVLPGLHIIERCLGLLVHCTPLTHVSRNYVTLLPAMLPAMLPPLELRPRYSSSGLSSCPDSTSSSGASAS